MQKRQRISELQDNKIVLLQEEISSLQSSLSQKEKEMEKMKQWVGNGAVPEGKVNKNISNDFVQVYHHHKVYLLTSREIEKVLEEVT